jgi:hypothetical protein
MYPETARQPEKKHWLSLVCLCIIAAAGECFLLFVFVASGRSGKSPELPMVLLKWILPFMHMLPLIASYRVIGRSMSQSSSGAIDEGMVIWMLFTAYVSIAAIEIGLVILFGHRYG